MSGKRLLILTTDLEIGGTPTVVYELARRLHRRGRAVAVACLAALGPVGLDLDLAGVDVFPLDARGPFDFRAIGRLDALIARQMARPFDCILSLLVHANAAAAPIAIRRGIPLFQSIQTTQRRPAWHWQVQRLIAPAAQRIIVPTESVAQIARELSGIRRERIEVIPNGVDWESQDAEISWPQTLAEGNAKARIGFLGRLDPVKRIGDLIDAAVLLHEQNANVRLEIFGEGEDRGRIERHIASNGASEFVRLRGAAQRGEALGQMDVLVLPSEAEGFGLVLIEAMAAGVPVVGTRVAGIRDVIRDEENGLLAEPASPQSLARQIGRILSDRALAGRLAGRARREVKQRYDWEKIVSQYEGVLGL